MIAIYCRQSVDKKDSISIEQQEQACIAFTFGNPYKVFKDKGFTGANTNRPAFVEMMNEVRNRQVTKVIVYKVDRISRSLQDFVGIYSEFERYGVEFVSCNEQFDTSNAMGKATLQIIMVFAELERSMIQKRVHDNFYERGKKGLFLAGVAPFGFRKIPVTIDGIHTQKLEADEEMYKNYLRYSLPVDTKLTQVAGTITVRMTFVDVKGEESEEICKLETNSTTISIQKPDGFNDFVTFEDIEASEINFIEFN